MKNAKADAGLYILTLLLQRLEEEKPGLLTEMIQGVKSDSASIAAEIPEKDHINQVFEEALNTLERADSLLKSSGNS